MRKSTNLLPSKRTAFWGSNLILALIAGGLLALLALMYHYQAFLQLERQSAVIRARLEAIHQEEMAKLAAELKVQEIALMKEFDCIRLTLFWESQRRNEADMTDIARNIMTRVDSPAYPDTICGVVNEVRKNADGRKVAMYSYIFDNRGRPQPSHPDWKLAGRVTHKVMVAHAEGRLAKGGVNYHAPYVNPAWAKRGLATCQLERLESEGYHLFYTEVKSGAEQQRCRASRAFAASMKAEKDTTAQPSFPQLPQHGPKPQPRPDAQGDEVANLILTAN